jgi:hypothetical protein
MRRTALLLSIALAAAALSPRPARADAPLVTVVRPAGPDARLDEAVTRLSAELRAAGFEVHVVSTEGAPAEARAVATMALCPTARGPSVELHVADQQHRVDPGEASGDSAAGDLAIRSLELLRASLLEERARRHTPTAEARGPSAPPSPAPEAAPRAAARLPTRAPGPFRGTIDARAALLAGAFGVAPTPLLRVAAAHGSGLSLGLALAPAPGATTLRAPEGSLALRQTLGFLDLAFTFRPDDALLRPRLSLGAGVYQLRVSGHAAPPFRSERHDLLAAAFMVGAGLGLRLGEGLTAIAAVEALALSPRPAVAVLDRELARAGLVTFLPSLGLSARF